MGARRAVRAGRRRRARRPRPRPCSPAGARPRSASSATPAATLARDRRRARGRRRAAAAADGRRARGARRSPALRLAARDRRAPAARAALDAALPADRIVAVDSTQPGYAANHVLDVEHPGSWLMPIGYGCLGCALPMAIGAKLAAPERPVLALAGDGGVAVHDPGARHRRATSACRCRSWSGTTTATARSATRWRQAASRRSARTPRPPTSSRIAEGFGCRGARAESIDHVGAARRARR